MSRETHPESIVMDALILLSEPPWMTGTAVMEAGRMMRDEPIRREPAPLPGPGLEEGDQPCLASAGSINLDTLPVSVSDGPQSRKRPCSHNGGFVVAQAIVCSPVEIGRPCSRPIYPPQRGGEVYFGRRWASPEIVLALQIHCF